MKYANYALATVAAALLLPATATAGEAEMTNTTMTNYTDPAPMQHRGLFLGGGADYMFDSEEVFYNGHLGYDFGNGSSLFLESGWIGNDENAGGFFPVDVDIVPVTLNFKHEFRLNDRLGLYIGAGAGASNIDISTPLGSDDEWTFTAQAIAGVVYHVTPNFDIYAGGRYLWLDDVEFRPGARIDELDDVGAGLGLRFNF